MKRLILIIVAITAGIMPIVAEAQNQITLPSKNKTEQDAILQNLINNMVYVEGGSFMMGSDDRDIVNSAKPMHNEIVKSFIGDKATIINILWHRD